MEGFTDIGLTTCYSRGTTSYRAPEIIVNNPREAKFSKKSDVWAFGCVAYEAVFLERLFPHDLDAKSFAISGKSVPVPYSRDVDGLRRDALIWLLQATLHFDPQRRISAEVANSFCSQQSGYNITRLSDQEQSCFDSRYSYNGRWLPPSPGYPGFESDVDLLVNIASVAADPASHIDGRQIQEVIVTTILPRSPSEIADLRERCMERGANLGSWLANFNFTLSPIEKLAIVALTSSALELDLFILHRFCRPPNPIYSSTEDDFLPVCRSARG